MSLATRCSACGTLFRVVQDQLRVSEGWVRCGRCDTVFNALEALVDLDDANADGGAPLASDPTTIAPRAEEWPATEIRSSDFREPLSDHGAATQKSDEPLPPPWPPVDIEVDPEPPADTAAVPVAAPALLQQPSPSAADTPAPNPAWTPQTDPSTVRPADHIPVAIPGFVRRAEREARWSSPAMRAALISLSLMLAVVLAAQVAYHFRDDLAARSEGANTLLQGACARWGCRVEPPRHLSRVTLEGHALSRIPQQPKAVKLAIQLRNRSGTELALPSIDLSLTDMQGQLIARRALSPSDFRIEPPVIARRSELPLEVVLSVGEPAIVGYTVELFYP